MNPTRREFFLAAGALLAVRGVGQAIEPIQRNGTSHIRLSLAAYSYRKSLDLAKPARTLEDFIDIAAKLEVDAVETTAYYYPETSDAYLAKIKGKCTRLGLDVSGTAVKNNFCLVDPGKLKAEVNEVKKWIDITSFLGGKTIRIFAGKLEADDTEDKARGRCIDCIQQVCDHGGKRGVYVALENHAGITSTSDQMLAIVKAVRHDWFGVNWDSANFRTKDPYEDLRKLAPYAVVAQIKDEIQYKDQKRQPADYDKLIGILRGVAYRGYLALEYEGEKDADSAVPKLADAVRKALAK